MGEFVYILTHDAMPGLVKIGRTSTSVEERVSALSGTSVPFAFRCFYAAEVRDSNDVERRLHDAFQDHWVGKEFYKIHPRRAMVVLEMVALREATPKDEIEDADSAAVAIPADREKVYARRFSMHAIGLKKGDILEFARDASLTCVVETDSTVVFEGEELSLSRAALLAIHKCGYTWKTIPGPVFWMYQGEPLKEMEARLRGEE